MAARMHYRSDEPDPARREVVIFIGSLAAGMLGGGGESAPLPTSPTSPSPVASSSPAASGCVVRPQLTFRVTRSAGGACSALAGAFVDVWHCDALGTYSDTSNARDDVRHRLAVLGTTPEVKRCVVSR